MDDDYENTDVPLNTWVCPACNAEIEVEQVVCWNCGYNCVQDDNDYFWD